MDDHPLHLHRHIFELRQLSGRETRGVMKDTVRVNANSQVNGEFTANDPGLTFDTWTWEIRPIVDKAFGRWYLAFNPALERTWHGPDVHQGLTFAPAAKVSYDFTRQVSGGIEYYADYGAFARFDSLHEQQQRFLAATDLNLSPEWEINFGVGIGVTAATDHLIIKGIIGRRFNWHKPSRVD